MRGPACSALPAVCQHLESSALTQMVRPKLVELAKDSSDLVRELLADHLIKLAPVLGKQQTIDLLLDPLLTLLRDRTPEVPSLVLCCEACESTEDRHSIYKAWSIDEVKPMCTLEQQAVTDHN